MIRLPSVTLPVTAERRLRQYQHELDGVATYEERVAEAKRRFATANKASNATFRAVRAGLSAMCSGARRCAYCEDSAADEVEHVAPKSLYPERTFDWTNYVYACGPCNGPKNNRFSILHGDTREVVDVSRRRGGPVAPPPPGDPLLVDPRSEDPLDFMELDLLGTFLFLPRSRPGTESRLRAEYTIEVLRLNDRDELIAAREEAYRNYRSRVHEYVKRRDEGVSKSARDDLRRAVGRMGHPTVWREMVRKHAVIPELATLFAAAPETLLW